MSKYALRLLKSGDYFWLGGAPITTGFALEWFFGMENEIKFNPFMVLAINDSQLSNILFTYPCEKSVWSLFEFNTNYQQWVNFVFKKCVKHPCTSSYSFICSRTSRRHFRWHQEGYLLLGMGRYLATLLQLRHSCIYASRHAELSSGLSALGNYEVQILKQWI